MHGEKRLSGGSDVDLRFRAPAEPENGFQFHIACESLREMRCLKARETLTGQEVRDESGADIEIRNTHT
jgi:hypothetical protein